MSLIEPHGGVLCDSLEESKNQEPLKRESVRYPSITLSQKQMCDLELLLNGGFSPLRGFMNRNDYERVLSEMRLGSGHLWPLPIVLDLDEATARSIDSGHQLVLRDLEGNPLAIMEVEDLWQPDKKREAEAVFGTDDIRHTGVAQLNQLGPYYAGGSLRGLQLPDHFDFTRYRHTPRELRQIFQKQEWTKVVAFQTRNPLHRVHEELIRRAGEEVGAKVLLHPVVGLTQPGDVNYLVRVHCYRNVIKRFPGGDAMLSLLPLAMRMAGPREALWHAIIRKNYGCSHFIVGRDHAGPGPVSERRGFYEPYEAQELVQNHSAELGITIVPSKALVYLPEKGAYFPADEVPKDAKVNHISSTDLRNRLRTGEAVPEWLIDPQDVEELRKAFVPRNKQGFTVFFTGLSGAGKSTVAKALFGALQELNRPISLLDGDVVRLNLSKGLGFSKEDRDINIRRIGYVASEITKCGGIALCAPIAPYEETRQAVRSMIQAYGGFVEVHISTSLEVCEARDAKGLYAKARKGLIKEFTGIDDPYEEPSNPELKLDTARLSVREAMHEILAYLQNEKYLADYQ